MAREPTEKQKRFIDYYIETGNATEAARLAGYKGNNLNRIGSENLSKLDTLIQEKLAQKDAERIASQDEVLAYLSAVMRGELTEETPILCGEGCQELVEKDIGAKDRIKAAELLGKRYGLFTDKVSVDVIKPVVISGADGLED